MCTRELTAYQNPDGGRPLFGYEGYKRGLPIIKLPCGKCPECQKDYYTQWATRGSRELERWPISLFITLTYNDEHLPADRSLNKKDVQDFIKRVKKHANSSKENPIRQIYCGEYGTKTLRPHYHVILFNLDFEDAYHWRNGDKGEKIFRSPTLEKLWPFGSSEFGIAQPGAIAYLFKYVLKKKTRKEKEKPLELVIDGEIHEVAHEFIEASRNPGIGAHMRESQSIKKGYLSVQGVKTKLPKYYMNFLQIHDPKTFEKLKDAKFEVMVNRPKETTLRKQQREETQKLLTDTKKKI